MNLFYYNQDYEKLKMKMRICGECINIKCKLMYLIFMGAK
jgi:ribosomal protein S27AE